MSLVLYGHPFSSYTQKVLIALYENDTRFEFRSLGPDTPQNAAEWLQRWPLQKFPLLVDNGRSVVETSIIIEYLQLKHPGRVRLLPADPMAALDVRFFDRFFDLHIMDPVQFAGRREQFQTVLADRFEHRETGLLGRAGNLDDQAVLDQGFQPVERLDIR